MNVMQTLSLSLSGRRQDKAQRSPPAPLPPPFTRPSTKNHGRTHKIEKRVKIKEGYFDTKGYIVIKDDARDVQGLLLFTGKVTWV